MDAHNDADDVGYFTDVIHNLVENFNADIQSVFLAGMSNGGFMVNRLACAWASVRFRKRTRLRRYWHACLRMFVC